MHTISYLIVVGVLQQIRVPRLAHSLVTGSLDLLCIKKSGKASAEMICNVQPCSSETFKAELKNDKNLGLQESPLNPSYNS